MCSVTFRTAIALGFTLGITTASAQPADKVAVLVSGLCNDSGVVRCGLYASSNGFPQAGQETRGAIGRINGQRATCTFNNLKPGTYAIAAFHAEQNETQMQYGMFGKPKEGYGFSRNASSSFGPPTFDAAAFEYRGGNQTFHIRLQY